MAADDRELHTLAGAYVMDAVTEVERDRFDQHLACCDECRAEIRELREATARVAAASQVRPRAELRGQTIRAASRISQLPPAVPEDAAAPEGPAAPGRASITARRPRDQPLAARRSARRGPRRFRQRSRAGHRLTSLPRSVLAAAVVLIAAAATFTVVMHDTMQQLDHSQRQTHLIATVLNAPDVTMATARVRTGGTATVVMSRREHALVFTAHGLRALPATKSYELWLMGPTGDRPCGLLKTPGGGMAGPAVVAGLGAGDMIGLTVEPAAGSAQPTSPPIVLIGPKIN